MNIRKNLGLVVSAAIAIPLIAVAVAFLVVFALRYAKVRGQLQSVQTRLEQLNRRRPFPNEENIRQLERNRAALDAEFRRTLSDMARGQFEPPPLEPARFSQELRGMGQRLARIAQTNNVARPPQFGYGFDRYFRGDLPRKDEMPRLLTQVNAVESVCSALFEAGIAEIVKVDRQVFEEQPGAGGAAVSEMTGVAVRMPVGMETAVGPGGLPARALADPGGLFSWERVAVEFVTRESGLWNALNALGRSRAYAVVAGISVVNETAKPQISVEDDSEKSPAPPGGGPARPGFRPPPATPGGEMMPEPGARPLRPPTREERIVTGRDELLKVRIEVDVFHFRSPAAAEK